MSQTMEKGPSASPPSGGATSIADRGVSAPTRYSDQEIATRTTQEGQAAHPMLLPPEVVGAEEAFRTAGAQAITATWRTGMFVTATWSINEPRNAWMYVKDLGWRKLYNGRDHAHLALVALAAQARETGSPISFREEADGMVYEIYLW